MMNLFVFVYNGSETFVSYKKRSLHAPIAEVKGRLRDIQTESQCRWSERDKTVVEIGL